MAFGNCVKEKKFPSNLQRVPLTLFWKLRINGRTFRIFFGGKFRKIYCTYKILVANDAEILLCIQIASKLA